MRLGSLAATFAGVLAVSLSALAQTDQADVALVLAVDVSGSVDEGRFHLQREGIAAALESDAFAGVIANGVNQTIEIAVIEWAEEQRVVVPWTVIRGHGDLMALAGRLRRAGRSWVHTMTDPAGGIAGAARLFAAQPLTAGRRVIDVSGDGAQNAGTQATAEVRDAVVSGLVTINGLPITSGDDPHVDDWYGANVIGGPGAFLVVADGYDAFAEALRQKLILEVAERPPQPPMDGSEQRRRADPEACPIPVSTTAATVSGQTPRRHPPGVHCR